MLGRWFTPYFIYGILILVLVTDFGLFMCEDDATISVYFWELPYRDPALFAFWCWGMGVLTCHLLPFLRAHKIHKMGSEWKRKP